MIGRKANLIFCVISSFLMFSSCAGAITRPPKPIVEACQLDVVHQLCLCGLNNNPDHVTEMPLAYCDKGVLLRPGEWEKYKNWIDKTDAELVRSMDVLRKYCSSCVD